MIRAENLQTAHQISFTNGRHTAVADVPVEKGGEGNGFGPHELIEAALASCVAMNVRMAAEKNDIPLVNAICEASLDRSVPGQATLRYEVKFEGALSAEQIAQLQEAAGSCPVSKTLSGIVRIERNDKS